MDDDDHRGSGIESQRRSSSFTGSFRAIASMIGSGGGKNSSIHNLQIPKIKMFDKGDYKKQQHHCRICANAVCGECSRSTINKQRCCDVCAEKYSKQEQESMKNNFIFQLEGIAGMFVAGKKALEQEIRNLDKELQQADSSTQTVEMIERKIAQIQQQIEELKMRTENYNQQIQENSEQV